MLNFESPVLGLSQSLIEPEKQRRKKFWVRQQQTKRNAQKENDTSYFNNVQSNYLRCMYTMYKYDKH